MIIVDYLDFPIEFEKPPAGTVLDNGKMVDYSGNLFDHRPHQKSPIILTNPTQLAIHVSSACQNWLEWNQYFSLLEQQTKRSVSI